MEQKDKILGKLKEIIDEGNNITPSNGQEFKSWIRKTESFIERVTDGVIKEDAMKVIHRTPFYVATTSTSHDDLEKQTINHYEWQLSELIPILGAIYGDIEFFENPEMKKETTKIKKHFELEGGIPGLIKGKWGVKEV